MTRRNRTRRALLLLTAVTMVAGTAGSSQLADWDSRPTDVVAVFVDASPLVLGNDVKVDGVAVGVVKSMDVRDGKAAVTLEVDPSALPLHNDARATIRPVSLLGERYVDLDRGSADAPVLGSGEVIPVERTGQATDLDQILNTVDEPTGQSLSALVAMLGQGMDGNGANIDATVKALAPAMQNTDRLARVLADQNAVLNQLVDNVTPVAEALATDGGRTMDRLVDSSNRLLATTSQKQDALRATLSELPSTLAQARQTLTDLTGAANSAAPALQGMRPATDNLVQLSQELNRFADSADPALANATPVLERANELLDQARPVVDELVKAGPDLRGLAQSAVPIVNRFADHLPGFWNFIQGWALTTNGHDGLSHYFRAMVTLNTDQITHLLPLPGLIDGDPGGTNSDAAKQPVAQGPAAPTAPLPQLPGVLGSILAPGTTPDGGATGLSPQQETNALQFLLGGL